MSASMALAPSLNHSPRFPPWNGSKIVACSNSINPPINSTSFQSSSVAKRCLRCHTVYSDVDNSPSACVFHGHITGERGLFALSPPHQGIDGEWSDGSGVIVYKWNDKSNRPNSGTGNWKRRWSCCSEYDERAPPCRRGWHVSYDDGFTLY
ncbi:uncharacterized protein LOC101205320 [Cucumis sativus]|uniref:Uncharacterized protein n=1 Tax=Cucumis sativus TaxID=3659 RepID=A0A0A0K8C8_CUCSA|nr:uncharacterized protein LOC101205320 [Cucumis sativus]KGN45139.1 hypothetical protein Csa_016073 [Cucumis sativus]